MGIAASGERGRCGWRWGEDGKPGDGGFRTARGRETPGAKMRAEAGEAGALVRGAENGSV